MKLTKSEEFAIRIKRLGIRHSTVAEKARVSPPKLSLMMNGYLPFPDDIKLRIEHHLSRLERLREGE